MAPEVEKAFRQAGIDPYRHALESIGRDKVAAALANVLPGTGVGRAWYDFHMSGPDELVVALDLDGDEIARRKISVIDICGWEARIAEALDFDPEGSPPVRLACKPGLDWCDPERVAGFDEMRELAWERGGAA